MAYATSNDYLAWADVPTAPPGLGRVLEVASTRIDELVIGVVYPTDDRGQPTEVDIADILRRATCEQALYMFDLGDTTGARSNMKRMDIGRIMWQRAENPNGTTDERYSPNAVTLLQVEGMRPVNVLRLP